MKLTHDVTKAIKLKDFSESEQIRRMFVDKLWNRDALRNWWFQAYESAFVIRLRHITEDGGEIEGYVCKDEDADDYQPVRQAGFIDLTPTWSAILPLLLEGFENGTPESRGFAIEELKRMALLADRAKG